MKPFFDWLIKALTGALAVGGIMLAAGSHVFPVTVPLLTVGGRIFVLNMTEAFGLIVFVLLAAVAFYIFGYSIWKAMGVLWSKF
jgi:uncharacterized membrane protein